MVKILLFCSDSVAYDGMGQSLRENDFQDFKMVRVENDAEALGRLKEKFDFLFLDLEAPSTKILGFIAQMRVEYFSLPLICFSSKLDYAFVKRCLIDGITGYCHVADHEYQEISSAIKKNQSGKVYISPVMVELVASEALYSRKPDRLDSLNTQEFDILLHLKKGFSFSEIAKTFGIHLSTVSFYKSRILDKLMISDVLELENFSQADSVL